MQCHNIQESSSLIVEMKEEEKPWIQGSNARPRKTQPLSDLRRNLK